MGGICFCGFGCGCQSEDPLCLLWRETHAKGLRVRFPTRPEEDEGRKVPERTEEKSIEQGSQQKRAVKRGE